MVIFLLLVSTLMQNQIINWASKAAKNSSTDVALLCVAGQRSMIWQSFFTRFITLGFLGNELVDFYADVAVRQGVHERIEEGLLLERMRKQRKQRKERCCQ
jgi:hypothetical protein